MLRRLTTLPHGPTPALGQAAPEPSVARDAGMAFVRGFAAGAGMLAAFLLIGRWSIKRGVQSVEKNIRTRVATALTGDAAEGALLAERRRRRYYVRLGQRAA